jgi:Flp pilus assembly protein TadD
MNLKKNKKVYLFLLVGIFILYLIGCSTIQNTINWARFGRSPDTSAQDKNLTQFFSNIRPTPGNPDSHYLLAAYYQQRGRHKEAIEEFQKVLSIDPGHFKACNGMGVSYDLLGNFPKAVEAYEAALVLNPNLDYVQNNLGYSLLLQGNVDRAVAAFKKAIDLNEGEQRFHNNLGLALAEKGEYDSALAEFKLGGDEATAHFNLAELYFKKGKYEEAKIQYVLALKTNPSNTVAQTSLKAANALVAIFQTTPKEAEAKRVIIPDSPAVKNSAEKEEITGNQTPEVDTVKEAGQNASISQEKGKVIDPVEPKESNVAASNAIPHPITELTIPKAADPGIQQADIKKPIEFPPEAIVEPIDLYELRVGSFRVEENARVESNSLQEAGYQTSLKQSKDKNGKEWYLLFAGPMPYDKALATKEKIGKEFHHGVEIQSLEGKDAGIEISNGNGVNRMARKVGDYLKERGLSVKRLTNYRNFNQGFTRIYYQEGHIGAANHVARQLPATREMIELKKLDRPYLQVKVLLGKDMIPYRQTF